MPSDTRLYTGARLLTMREPREPGRIDEHGAILERGGRIVALGPAEQLLRAHPDCEPIELAGRLVTPGLIDCHTHILYGGERSRESERRLAGESYEVIARAGGGILSTVSACARLSEAQLCAAALPRIDALLADGVTTLEIKSGYGLTLEAELRMLRAVRALASLRPVSIRATYLAAHALPAGFLGGAEAYIERVCGDFLPAVAASGLADAVDAYCEQIAFSSAQVQRVLETARQLGLPGKVHADQLSNMHAAALAARCHALSADHLEFTDAAGVMALARAGTVAVLLPGAYYFLRQQQPPPVQLLREAAVPIAVATDCNPGTSPLAALLTAMNLAAVLFGLSTMECLAGVTRHAARALGVLEECGSLEPGKWCDLAIWSVEQPAELVHALGMRALHARVWHGQWQPAAVGER
jgi:imidazolonepropionase